MQLNSLLLASSLSLTLFLSGCGEKKSVQRPLPEVKTATLRQQPINQEMRAVGETIAADSVELVARVEGYLQKRHFSEGQMVKKGALLYEIEPEIYIARVKAAEADLEKAKANAQNANIDYERQKSLVTKDATSERSYDNAIAVKMQADADVKAAEANLSLAKTNLSYTKINAPFDGWVGLSAVSEGNLVNPSLGTLASIQRIDPMRVEFVLGELDLLELKKNTGKDGAPDQVNVELEFQNGERYDRKGKISFWNNKINSTTGTIRLQALFDNPTHQLIPGMFVRVILTPRRNSEALLVPLTAVMSDQAGDYVYLVDADGTVSRRTIKTGYRNEEYAIVLDKLKAGDQVIVEGLQKTRPGSKVRLAPSSEEKLKPTTENTTK